MMVGTGVGTGGGDLRGLQKEDLAGAAADHADSPWLLATVGQHGAKEILGPQPLQDGPGAAVFVADHRGGAGADNADLMGSCIVAADSLPGAEGFCPGAQAGEQLIIFFH